MEPKFRTSFIPKKTLEAASSIQKKNGSSLGILTLIALVIALGAIVLSVGVFLYVQYLNSSITSKTDTLTRAEGAFEPALIEELVHLNSRIKEAETVLNQHITPSSFFESLGGITLQSVQFSDFSMTRISEGRIGISMKGTANDFRGVALQADIFGKSRMIREPIFSNLNLDQDGKAVFNVTALLDPALIRYVDHIPSNTISTQ